MDKWFLYGQDSDFDTAMRTYDQGAYAEAASQFEIVLEKLSVPPALKKLSKSCLVDCLMKLSKDCAAANHPIEAQQLLQRAIAVHPNFADVRLRMAQVLKSVGDLDGAAQHLTKALEINPRFAQAKILLAIMTADHDPAKGWDEFVNIILERPHLESAIERFGIDETNFAARGEELLNNKIDVKELLKEAKAALNDRNIGEAIEILTETASIAPDYPDVRCSLAKALMEDDEVEDAVPHLMHAISVNANYADAHAMLGIALRRLGDRKAAADCFARALAIDPDPPVASLEAKRA